ncbi:FHA domain-containing protein [Thermodesulfobacteriota bacterium]
MTKLYILNGNMAGHSFDLKEKVSIIGRGKDSDIRIKEKSISRRHAKVIRIILLYFMAIGIKDYFL